MNISTLLEVGSEFETRGLPVLRTIFFCVSVVCAIVIIVTTLLQSNNSSEGLDGLMNSQESYYAQNKGSSRDGKLKIITIVMAVTIILCIIAYFITKIFSGN